MYNTPRGMTLYDYCMKNDRQELLEQWDIELNLPYTPETITSGSHYLAHWRCVHGHCWTALVKSRTQGSGCPICAKRVIIAGVNDLATTHPALAAQWDSEKNAPLTPQQIVSGSERKVWWRCPSGHSWESRIHARVKGNGCPYCAGRKALAGVNDLASRNPALAALWDYDKNDALTPQQVTALSNRYVWWKCPLGHSYRAMVAHAKGCPYCSGHKVLAGFNDLATLRPELAAQWCQELNAPLTPQEVRPGSHRKVWWECQEGHRWKAAIYSRTAPQKCGCPLCAGMVRSKDALRYEMMLRAKRANQALRARSAARTKRNG